MCVLQREGQGEEGRKEFDVYDEMLTQAELQGNLNLVNSTDIYMPCYLVNKCIDCMLDRMSDADLVL